MFGLCNFLKHLNNTNKWGKNCFKLPLDGIRLNLISLPARQAWTQIRNIVKLKGFIYNATLYTFIITENIKNGCFCNKMFIFTTINAVTFLRQNKIKLAWQIFNNLHIVYLSRFALDLWLLPALWTKALWTGLANGERNSYERVNRWSGSK